jgi:hypothetical protein
MSSTVWTVNNSLLILRGGINLKDAAFRRAALALVKSGDARKIGDRFVITAQGRRHIRKKQSVLFESDRGWIDELCRNARRRGTRYLTSNEFVEWRPNAR